MTVTGWVPRKIPTSPPLPVAQLREQAYNTEEIIPWADGMITVTAASTLWQYYAAEGSSKADELQAQIVSAKDEIRARFSDKGGEST